MLPGSEQIDKQILELNEPFKILVTNVQTGRREKQHFGVVLAPVLGHYVLTFRHPSP